MSTDSGVAEAVAIVAAEDIQNAATALAKDVTGHTNVAIPVESVSHAEGDKEEAAAIDLGKDAEAVDAMDVDAIIDDANKEEGNPVQTQAQAKGRAMKLVDEAKIDTSGEASGDKEKEKEKKTGQEKENTPQPPGSPAAKRIESPARTTRGASSKTYEEASKAGSSSSKQASSTKKASGKASATEDELIELGREDENASEAEAEEDDEQYEIEAIMGHEKVGKGFRYLVSWVGYAAEHNSWVNEEDFAGTEMIDEYWKSKGGRPSRGRKSIGGTATASQANGSSSRKRNASESVAPETSTRSKRGRRNGSAAASSASVDADADAVNENLENDVDDQDHSMGRYAKEHIDSVSPYANLKNWEDQVKKVVTVERSSADEKLIVYLLMKGGEKIAQDSEVVYERCPKKMFAFYEEHLKWKRH